MNNIEIVRRVAWLLYAIFEILLRVIFWVWFIIGSEISWISILSGVDSIHFGINLQWISISFTGSADLDVYIMLPIANQYVYKEHSCYGEFGAYLVQFYCLSILISNILVLMNSHVSKNLNILIVIYSDFNESFYTIICMSG